MPAATMTARPWEQRIHRAEELAKSYSFAAEILNFYREIATFQKSVHSYLETSEYESTADPRRLPENWDSFVLLPRFQPLLQIIEKKAPRPLAEKAKELSDAGPERWKQVIGNVWESENGSGSDAEDFFALAFLQPYAEYLSRRGGPWANYTPAVCPFCSRKPMLGILRPGGDGAKRSLLCSLCLTEWEYRRIVCPACDEKNLENLPIFTAPEFAHIRVDACDMCKTYIKSVDLTKDGRANPIVDELAAIPLSLWAEEKGYSKLQPNLLRT
jgi:FdhE protein